jgi:Zn-dependent metalloprotease
MGGFVVYAAYAPVDSTLLSRDIELKEDPQTRQINWIKGNFLANKSLEKKQVATQFLSQAFSLTSGDPSVRAARSHREPAIDFVLNRETRDALTNNTIVRLQQTVNNVPIFGREIAVHITPYNAVRLVIGSVMDTAIDTNPTLSADQATTVARQHIANHASGDYVVTQAAALSLVVHESIPQLVWHLVIEPVGRLGARWQYFVDAHTGDIDRFNSTPSHLNRTVHAYDSSESTYNNSNPILKEGGNQDGIHPVFTDPYQFVGDTDQYFTNYHNHHGINGQDPSSIKILVDPAQGAPASAFYFYVDEQDYVVFYGHSQRHLAQDLDVVAHEYCHGITQHTSQLIYLFQSGALNESMSDICAVLVDDFVKESGEQDAEIWSIAEVGFGSAKPLRRMDTPAEDVQDAQPEHMDDFKNLGAADDNGGVHSNSGIVNKAFYAVAQGVGLANAAKIYYRAWVTYFNQDTNFVQARRAVEQAAIDLYGSGAQRVVQGAFDSVGILDTVGASESASPDSTNFLGFLAGPNPYRGGGIQNITFQFDLPREANVLIQVYSLSGRLVYEHEARYGAGIKKAAWDARDLSGVPVANGMYAAYIVAKQDGARWVKKQAIGILR